MKTDHIAILKDNMKAVEQSVLWLQRSHGICSKINHKRPLRLEDMDAFEVLARRFSRTTNLLFNKVYRSIHYIQEGESRPWLDVLLYMEKAGLLDSVENARVIKELRNDVVHEYTMTDIQPLYSEVFRQSPNLLRMVDDAMAETSRIMEKLSNR